MMSARVKRKIPRTIKSIRVSYETWENWDNFESKFKISKTNLLETLFHHSCPEKVRFIDESEVIKLQESLKLKPNAGGAIKAIIREVLASVREISQEEIYIPD